MELVGASYLLYASATGQLGEAAWLGPAVAGVVGLETVWLLPALFKRAALIIKGEPVPPSKMHLAAFVTLLAKTAGLLALAIKLA